MCSRASTQVCGPLFVLEVAIMFKKSRITSMLLALALLALPGRAQIRSGTITGSVLDASGAAITDANVTVSNTATNVSYSTHTNQDGLFTVPYLENGTYSVVVTKTGFETFTEDGLHLDPSATVRVAAVLRVGATS